MYGGRVYGQGMKGKTIDMARIDGDDDTMYAFLSLMAPADRAKCHAWLPDGKTRVRLTSAQFDALLKAAENATDLISKRIHSEARGGAKATFVKEMRSNTLVRNAYGEKAYRHFTTLGSLQVGKKERGGGGMEVMGLETPDAFYIMSRKCEVPLDRYKFTPASIDAFLGDVLSNIDRLHKGGMYHCDLKLDNMIFCAKERRFKLIDWGNSDDEATLVARYEKHERPKVIASPVSWMAWGLGPLASVASMTQIIIMNAGPMMTCPMFRAFMLSCKESFSQAIEQEGGFIKKELGRGKSDAAFSRAITKKYACSFDLFSIGMVIAHIVCDTRSLSARRKAVLGELARKLTHYGAPDFIQDAGEALRWWKSNK
jgi:serine/threonine protein kinase